MTRTTTAVPATLEPTHDRDWVLARLREVRERPDTPETVAERKAEIARLQQIARGADTDTDPVTMPGAIALIREMDAERSDHIALAIAAHRLVRQTVIDDVTIGGQTAVELPRLLNLLTSYLDGCGWRWQGDAMHDASDPRELQAWADTLCVKR